MREAEGFDLRFTFRIQQSLAVEYRPEEVDIGSSISSLINNISSDWRIARRTSQLLK